LESTDQWLSRRSAQDVGVKFGRVGLRIVGGEFGRFIHLRAHLGIYLLQRVLREAFLDQALAHLLDGVMLGTHLLHFLTRAVFRRVGHGMTAIAVSQHFQDIGTLALATPLYRLIAGRLYGAYIHAVDLLTLD